MGEVVRLLPERVSKQQDRLLAGICDDDLYLAQRYQFGFSVLRSPCFYRVHKLKSNAYLLRECQTMLWLKCALYRLVGLLLLASELIQPGVCHPLPDNNVRVEMSAPPRYDVQDLGMVGSVRLVRLDSRAGHRFTVVSNKTATVSYTPLPGYTRGPENDEGTIVYNPKVDVWSIPISAPEGTAVFLVHGKLEHILPPKGASPVWSYAFAVNDRGAVVGEIPGPGRAIRGFEYSDHQLLTMGTFGGPNSQARAINASGQVVGLAETGERVGRSWNRWAAHPWDERVGSEHRIHAFLYGRGRMTDLDPIDKRSAANDINNLGDAVGYVLNVKDERNYFGVIFDATIPDSISDAVLFSHHNTLNLNSVHARRSEIHLESAQAIDDRGRIVAMGIYGPNSSNYHQPPSWLSELIHEAHVDHTSDEPEQFLVNEMQTRHYFLLIPRRDLWQRGTTTAK